jgi:hypothetical protein
MKTGKLGTFKMFLTFFKVFPKFSEKIHCGCIFQDILNIPLWNISVALFPHILNFTGSVNCGYFTGDITKNTLNEPPRNTVNGLNTSQAGDISVKLAGKILNVLGIFWVGIG